MRSIFFLLACVALGAASINIFQSAHDSALRAPTPPSAPNITYVRGDVETNWPELAAQPKVYVPALLSGAFFICAYFSGQLAALKANNKIERSDQ